MLIREKIVKLLTLMATAVIFSGCSLLPASRAQRAADEAATPTPIPTPIVAFKPTYEVQRGEIVDELYLTALSRRPTAAEKNRSLAHIDGATDKTKGVEDVLWAILNSKEFMFNH